jgi:hypothetical protein
MVCANIALVSATCAYVCQHDSDCVSPGCCASVTDHWTGKMVSTCATGSICDGGAAGAGGSGGNGG